MRTLFGTATLAHGGPATYQIGDQVFRQGVPMSVTSEQVWATVNGNSFFTVVPGPGSKPVTVRPVPERFDPIAVAAKNPPPVPDSPTPISTPPVVASEATDTAVANDDEESEEAKAARKAARKAAKKAKRLAEEE